MPTRGEAWNDEDIATLRRMARAGEDMLAIARKLERTQEGVAAKARSLHVSVAPSGRMNGKAVAGRPIDS